MATQLSPTGIAHAAQSRPVGHRQLQQRRRQRGDQTPMGYQHHRAIRLVSATPFRFAGNQLGNQRPTSGSHVNPAFPAVRRLGRILAPGQPGARGISVDLSVG